MTRISYIHGIGKAPAGEMKDRSKSLSTRQYIPFASLTDGEFRLHIMHKRLDALEQLYPEQAGLTRYGKSLIENAIYHGLHTNGNTVLAGRQIPNELQPVAKLITQGKRNFRPASGGSLLYRDSPAHVGDLIIPARDCETPPPMPANWSPPNSERPPYPQWAAHWKNANATQIQACRDQARFEAAVNKDLEASSAHVLYEFLGGNLNTMPSVVATKSTLQRGAFEQMARVGKWSKDSLKDWARLGIELSNAKQGVGLQSPETSISMLKQYPNEPGIGNPAAFIAVVKVLVAAIVAITALLQAIKSNKPNDPVAEQLFNFQSIGTKAFSADNKDWLGFLQTGTNPPGTPPGTTPPGTPTPENNTLLMGGLILGGVLLLTSK